MVPGLGIKCLNELSSSDLYKVILFKHPFEIKSKLYWNNKFTGVQIDWKLMFQQILNNDYLPKKCKDFNWKLFHGLVNTEKRLCTMKYSDGKCKLCDNKTLESIDHLLIECRYNSHIWDLMERVISHILDDRYKIDSMAIILGVFKVQDMQSHINLNIINVLLGICRYHLWKIRNNMKYGNQVDVGYNQSIKMLKYDLQYHIRILISSDNTEKEVKSVCQSIMVILERFM